MFLTPLMIICLTFTVLVIFGERYYGSYYGVHTRHMDMPFKF